MTDQANPMPGQPANILSEEISEEQEARLRRQRLLAVVRVRLPWLILLSIVLGAGFGVGGYYLEKPLYESAGYVQIERVLPVLIHQTQEAEIRDFRQYLQTQVNLIQSEGIVMPALDRAEWRAVRDADVPTDYRDFTKWLAVDIPQNTNLLRISFTHAEPTIAKAGADAVIRSYEAISTGREASQIQQRIDEVRNLRTQYLNRLDDLQAQRQMLADQFKTDDLKNIHERRLERLQEIEARISEIDLQLRTAGADGLSLEDEPSFEGLSVEQLAGIDPELRTYLRDKRLIEQEILRNSNLGDNHYTMVRLRSALEDMDTRIERRAIWLRQHMPRELLEAEMFGGGSIVQLESTRRELMQQYERLRAEADEIGRTRLNIARINAEIEKEQERLTQADRRYNQLLVEPRVQERIEVIPATLPTAPANSGKRKQFALLGAGAGCLLGTGFVLLLGLMDRRMRRIDDVRLGVPDVRVLGVLPELPKNLADRQQAALASQSIHHIRTLLQVSTDRRRRVLCVTSPAPGSGKTSMTAALGLSFAASHNRTLLIDLDIVSGELTRRFGHVAQRCLGNVIKQRKLVPVEQLQPVIDESTESGESLEQLLIERGLISEEQIDNVIDMGGDNAIGLIEACNGSPMENCIVPTGVDNLDLLPIGSASPEQAGNLSPTAVHRLVERAAAAYDVVLIDTGPVLGSLEASMAATEAEGTILVVSRGDDKKQTSESLRHLAAVNARVAGLVFNNALSKDMNRSSYWNVSSISRRRPGEAVVNTMSNLDASCGLGPVGAAVAMYTRATRDHKTVRDGFQEEPSNGRYEQAVRP